MEAAFKAVGGKTVTAFGHHLTRVRDTGGKIELTFDTAKGRKTVSFTPAVRAVPFTVLRQVAGFADGSLQGIDPRVLKSVRELQYGKNSKMMLGYNRRVWKEAGATGMCLANLFTINTWDTSRSQKHEQGILTSFSASRRAEGLSPAHVPQVVSDIEKIFPGTKAHHNGRAVVQNWPANPLARASYSSPSPGQFTTIVGACDQPLLDSRLFLAGEQTAPYYFGYMEGAVESGMRVAEQIRASRRRG
jgi:monoamine oxidase